ncbi:MAG: RCC1 domain-containing protein, partial [Nitrospiria bacterium]
TCALISDGTVYCWGLNSSGQLGNGNTANSSSPVLIPGFPPGITKATAISSGSQHTCALISDGTVYCWGLNSSGQFGNSSTANSNVPVPAFGITTTSSVTAFAIAAGESHTCALMSNLSIWCSGSNISGQLGNGTTTDSSSPVIVSGLTSATLISAGSNHTCAVLPQNLGNIVKCWGENLNGQLGFVNISSTSYSTAQPVSGL